MAGQIGNTHYLQNAEWQAIEAGERGPWCMVAVSQAEMHGGEFQVIVFSKSGNFRYDATAKVRQMAEDEENYAASCAAAAESWSERPMCAE